MRSLNSVAERSLAKHKVHDESLIIGTQSFAATYKNIGESP